MDLRTEQWDFAVWNHVNGKKLKSCNICYFTDEDKEGYKLSLYCKAIEILTQVSFCVYLLCQCPNLEYKSELCGFCDWCLFYNDLVTFSGEFNDIRASSKVMRIVRTLISF